jgi:uncharacterized protein (TIGR02646 family)
MLNITNRISLSKKTKREVKAHKREFGFASTSWSKIKNLVKNEISKKLLAMHGFRCVYCERRFIGIGNQVEHFAPKKHNPEFSFECTNLFYSCTFCNSNALKGQKPTVAVPDQYYSNCTFSILHPWRDNPNDHIIYRDADRVDIDITQCTPEGITTINFLEMLELESTLIRSQRVIIDRLMPLITSDERKLIEEAISYK